MQEARPEFQEELLRLQNQLFVLDHKKGELEKYVFEKDEATKILIRDQLQTLIQEYHQICDQIQDLISGTPDYIESSPLIHRE